MDFDASVAWPVYDWMGVSKAALEAVRRYLARDLGPSGVRVKHSPARSRPCGGRHPRLPTGCPPAGAPRPRSAGTWPTWPLSPTPFASCSRTGRAGSAARSSTWTAASTRWAPHRTGPPRPSRPPRPSAGDNRRVLLAIDVGNTQTHIGVFSGDTLQEHWRLATDRQATADALATTLANLLGLRDLSLRDVDSAITSSVVPCWDTSTSSSQSDTSIGGLLMVGPSSGSGCRSAWTTRTRWARTGS